uniref:Uncharacterized protein n=2 Tax=Lotus japonicus TaxID=34305 RepID=I3SAQ9_LOTJA|nr:unknown [Lotus japonicus]
MVVETELICQQQTIPVLDVKYHLHVAQEHALKVEVSPSSNAGIPVFSHVKASSDLGSAETPRFESAVSCTAPAAMKFTPKVRSGSCTDIGPRGSMDDEHIQIDDLAAHLGFVFKYAIPSAFYAVFDGHGGPDAAAFVKENAMRLFFEDADMLQSYDADAVSLKRLEDSHRRAF